MQFLTPWTRPAAADAQLVSRTETVSSIIAENGEAELALEGVADSVAEAEVSSLLTLWIPGLGEVVLALMVLYGLVSEVIKVVDFIETRLVSELQQIVKKGRVHIT